MNQGIHGIDLIQWMNGGVDGLFSYSDHLVRNIEVEDTAVIALKYKNGSFGVIKRAISIKDGEDTVFEIYGDKGTIIFGDSCVKKWETIDGKGIYDINDEALSGSKGPEISSFDHLAVIEDMVDAIKYYRKPMVTGEEATKAVDIILASYESAKTGREIKLK